MLNTKAYINRESAALDQEGGFWELLRLVTEIFVMSHK